LARGLNKALASVGSTVVNNGSKTPSLLGRRKDALISDLAEYSLMLAQLQDSWDGI